MKIIPQWRADRRPIRTARFLLWWGPSIANALISSHTQHNLSLSRPREMLHSSVAITFPKLTRSSQSTSTSDFHRPCIADFKRFKTDGHAQLQTALHTYHNKFPFSIFQPFLRVDLVSTIHIADKEYFASLQKELEGYDCVLYEMIASRRRLKNSRGPGKKLKSSSSRGFSIIGCIQQLMAKLLVLDFQLDCLDYKADNWYHADLDTETFKLLQLEKGESFFTLARDMTLKSRKAMVQPVCVDIGNQSEYPELEAVSKIDFCAAMKVFLAKKLTSGLSQVTADVEGTSVIIGERNRAATEALRRAIDGGNKKIAILYGVGHMPDLGRRLREEFDLVPSQVQWITAWSIKNRNLTSSSLPFLKKIAEIFQWPLNR